MKKPTILIAVCILLLALPTFAQKGKTKTKVDTPELSCVARTDYTITVRVSAPAGSGATGMPAGFSLQWMLLSDYQENANQWYASDDPRLCKASFSGNASGYAYSVAAGDYRDIQIGEIDNQTPGGSVHPVECGGDLECGKTYVFRAFAHATNTLQRSEFTPNRECSTSSEGCGTGDCTYTIGYWRNHYSAWPADFGIEGLGSGATLLDILRSNPGQNYIIQVQRQLIGALLNVAATGGTPPTEVQQAIDDALAAIADPASVTHDALSALVEILSSFNEGSYPGWGHC